jgi:hypothetical protein
LALSRCELPTLKDLAKPFDFDKTPFDVFDRRYAATNIALGRSSEILSARRGETVTRRDVENGLVSVLDLDDIFEEIDTEEILSLLADCNFASLRPVVLGEVVFEESILLSLLPG